MALKSISPEELNAPEGFSLLLNFGFEDRMIMLAEQRVAMQQLLGVDEEDEDEEEQGKLGLHCQGRVKLEESDSASATVQGAKIWDPTGTGEGAEGVGGSDENACPNTCQEGIRGSNLSPIKMLASNRSRHHSAEELAAVQSAPTIKEVGGSAAGHDGDDVDALMKALDEKTASLTRDEDHTDVWGMADEELKQEKEEDSREGGDEEEQQDEATKEEEEEEEQQQQAGRDTAGVGQERKKQGEEKVETEAPPEAAEDTSDEGYARSATQVFDIGKLAAIRKEVQEAEEEWTRASSIRRKIYEYGIKIHFEEFITGLIQEAVDCVETARRRAAEAEAARRRKQHLYEKLARPEPSGMEARASQRRKKKEDEMAYIKAVHRSAMATKTVRKRLSKPSVGSHDASKNNVAALSQLSASDDESASEMDSTKKAWDDLMKDIGADYSFHDAQETEGSSGSSAGKHLEGKAAGKPPLPARTDASSRLSHHHASSHLGDDSTGRLGRQQRGRGSSAGAGARGDSAKTSSSSSSSSNRRPLQPRSRSCEPSASLTGEASSSAVSNRASKTLTPLRPRDMPALVPLPASLAPGPHATLGFAGGLRHTFAAYLASPAPVGAKRRKTVSKASHSPAQKTIGDAVGAGLGCGGGFYSDDSDFDSEMEEGVRGGRGGGLVEMGAPTSFGALGRSSTSCSVSPRASRAGAYGMEGRKAWGSRTCLREAAASSSSSRSPSSSPEEAARPKSRGELALRACSTSPDEGEAKRGKASKVKGKASTTPKSVELPQIRKGLIGTSGAPLKPGLFASKMSATKAAMLRG